MEVPQNRPTDPAPPETEKDMISNLSEIVASLAREQRTMFLLVKDIHAETAGLSTAFHEVNRHLTAIKADIYLTSEQLTPFGIALGELQQRIARLEHTSRGG